MGQPRCVIERFAIGHQSGRGQNPILMRFDNPAVDVSRVSEIIRIHYKLSLERQNSASLIRRNFLGLARMSLSNWCSSPVAPFRLS